MPKRPFLDVDNPKSKFSIYSKVTLLNVSCFDFIFFHRLIIYLVAL